ncbi:NAD(P)/FAD-dependent oxidoreductase [Gemella cuniculi]|uniref:NAD(P)/FAD-dependent oxidoreductase n=1 Tax=Gemella cuniculi TaxID=150240 RepID=UPI0004121432|nr:aminoacetone oxidase family FAD-binding enzyme [Gemella cuniculi]
MQYDVIIIGLGSAGLMVADRLNDSGLRVLVLEQNRRAGVKLLLTGNGRCNVMSDDNAEDFVTAVHNGKFLRSAYHKYNIKKFFDKHNLRLKQENRRLYPASEKSRDVVNAFKIDHIKINFKEKVEELVFEDEKLIGVKTNVETYYGKNIVVCAGGKSYPQSGSDGSLHRILKKHGVKLTKIYPSEVSLIFDDFVELSGVALQSVRMFHKKNERTGDLLFTHKGLSGPLPISMGEFVAKYPEDKFYLDFYPQLSEEELFEKLWQNNKYLNGKLPKSFYNFMLKYFPENVSKKELRKFAAKIKRYELENIKTMPLEYAFTTAGGVDLKVVSPKTCSHKKIGNLYFAGEILDLHGEIGGYNLMVAWFTGMIVADAIKEKMGVE